MKGILPDQIRGRGKQGYSLPIKNWLRQELKDYMNDLFDCSPLLKEAFNLEYIRTLMNDHQEYRANHNHILWALINLVVWHRLFIEGHSLEVHSPGTSSTLAPDGVAVS